MSSTATTPADTSVEYPSPVNSPPSSPIPSLPFDVVLNCVARIPRCHHSTLSLVSKSFRSLLTSPDCYTLRSDLGFSEPLLHVCFSTPDLSSRWFTLRRTPHRTLHGATSMKSTGNRLVPVSSISSPTRLGSSVVAVGSEIYVIGGSIDGVPSSSVWVLDCRFHTWRRGPDMGEPREYAAACDVEGKIHVIAGCESDKNKWVETFDLKTQSWESVTGKDTNLGGKRASGIAVFDGKVYFMDERNNFFYDPKKGTLETAAQAGLFVHWRWGSRSWCVVGNELYCCDTMGKIRGYDMEEGVWREVKGVEALRKFLWLCAAMACHGGKLVVFWYGHWDSGGRGKSEIWCAEIALERHSDGEIWGSVEWFDVVLTVDNMSQIPHSLTVSV
ncbi:PREDICTED: F-box/kelch-repeat protein SKIP6-like [Tarenaya hassleriana]|uniref:F-box/kelch-repeat protein SKIP6-like n=1 Tax=Tarenaya hassleriana TaxID=28532 RepID=UPI0008FD7623|nr:PREDICTED: F-box/kelch-repeat protein SKIP6-like [Tarenaya hassleriana]